MCRAACRTTAAESGTNLAMVNIIKSQFGKEYEARGKEVRIVFSKMPYTRKYEVVPTVAFEGPRTMKSIRLDPHILFTGV